MTSKYREVARELYDDHAMPADIEAALIAAHDDGVEVGWDDAIVRRLNDPQVRDDVRVLRMSALKLGSHP